MILDTTVIIDVMKKEGKAIAKVKELADNGESLFITPFSVFELFTGAARKSTYLTEKAKIQKHLEGQMIVHFDADAAEKAGEIDGQLIKSGKQIGVVDCMIAGIAILKNETVLTRNKKDFERIDGLTVESY